MFIISVHRNLYLHFTRLRAAKYPDNGNLLLYINEKKFSFPEVSKELSAHNLRSISCDYSDPSFHIEVFSSFPPYVQEGAYYNADSSG